MKNIKQVPFILFLTILFVVAGCKDEEQVWQPVSFKVYDVNQPGDYSRQVIKHFGQMCIQSDGEFMKHFGKLNPLDLTKETLILGYTPTFYKITKVEQAFYVSNDQKYRYVVNIQTDSAALDSVFYGIIVDKTKHNDIEFIVSVHKK